MTQRFNQNNYLDILTKLLFLLLFTFGFGQESGFIIPDSLATKTCDELFTVLTEPNIDSIKRDIYYKTYLFKTKDEKKVRKQARLYLSIAPLAKTDSEKLRLYDLAIEKCDESGDINFMCFALFHRGVYFMSEKHNYNKALDDYIESLRLAEKINNQNRAINAKQSIAYLKQLIGEHEEALKYFKEILAYKKELEKENPYPLYRRAIYNCSILHL